MQQARETVLPPFVPSATKKTEKEQEKEEKKAEKEARARASKPLEFETLVKKIIEDEITKITEQKQAGRGVLREVLGSPPRFQFVARTRKHRLGKKQRDIAAIANVRLQL